LCSTLFATIDRCQLALCKSFPMHSCALFVIMFPLRIVLQPCGNAGISFIYRSQFCHTYTQHCNCWTT
jgi:hypothetical protein